MLATPCPACGYEMTGVRVLRCPECGSGVREWIVGRENPVRLRLALGGAGWTAWAAVWCVVAWYFGAAPISIAVFMAAACGLLMLSVVAVLGYLLACPGEWFWMDEGLRAAIGVFARAQMWGAAAKTVLIVVGLTLFELAARVVVFFGL